MKNTLIYILVRGVSAALGRLSLWQARRLGRWLGRVAYRVASFERRLAWRQLEQSFPEWEREEVEETAQGVFEGLGLGAAELCVLPQLQQNWSEVIDFPARQRQRLEEALAAGRGVVYVTAHLANWELMAAFLAKEGYPVCAFTRDSYDPRLTRLLSSLRQGYGLVSLPRGRPDSLRQALRSVRQGAIVGVFLDQHTKVPGVWVPFFGRPALTPLGAASLARQTGAPLLPGFLQRLPHGLYRLLIEPPLEPVQCGDRATDLGRTTARCAQAIEAAIRRNPEQWVWFHRRWRHPSGLDQAFLQQIYHP